MTQLNVTSKITDKSIVYEITALEHAGRVANHVAADHVFNDYIK